MTDRQASRAELRSQVRTTLVSLGDDAGAVARSLELAGVQGRPGDTRGCAIARYLNAVLACDERVAALEVTGHTVVVRRPGGRWLKRVTVASPEAVRAFVAAFDAGRFPGLVVPADRPREPSTPST